MGAAVWGDAVSLSETWRAYMERCNLTTRETLRGVPRELGLIAGAEDDIWDRFIRLPPNRALPAFALPDALRARLSSSDVDGFVRAHQHAAFFGIIADRLADRQVAPTPTLVEARRWILRSWEHMLAEALRDPSATRSLLAADLSAWRQGLGLERAAFAARSLSPSAYFHMVRLRLRWVSTTARGMLLSLGEHTAAEALVRAADRFLFACQCRDDALDADEDRRNRGASVADILRLTPGALVRVAVTAIARAEQIARAGGLRRFADWLGEFRTVADTWWQGEPPWVQSMGAMVLQQAADL
jgi:hypothetical protein